jgi:TPR repeat protein
MKGARLYSAALRKMYRRKPNTETAYDLLCRASELGHGEATHALGTWYLHGRHVRKDFKKAVSPFSMMTT